MVIPKRNPERSARAKNISYCLASFSWVLNAMIFLIELITSSDRAAAEAFADSVRVLYFFATTETITRLRSTENNVPERIRVNSEPCQFESCKIDWRVREHTPVHPESNGKSNNKGSQPSHGKPYFLRDTFLDKIQVGGNLSDHLPGSSSVKESDVLPHYSRQILLSQCLRYASPGVNETKRRNRYQDILADRQVDKI